jgi:hypothetical protein
MSEFTIDHRQDIYHRLSLLARLAQHMGSAEHYSEYEDDDFFGLYLLLTDVSKEIYPEWKDDLAEKRRQQETE